MRQSAGLKPFGVAFCGNQRVWQSAAALPKNETNRSGPVSFFVTTPARVMAHQRSLLLGGLGSDHSVLNIQHSTSKLTFKLTGWNIQYGFA